MEHLSFSEKINYLNENLSEERLFQIDLHLAECPACAQSIFDLSTIRDEFEKTWEHWVKDSSHRFQLKQNLWKALNESDVSVSQLEKLKTWFQHLFHRTGMAFTFVVERAAEKMERIEDNIDTLFASPYQLIPAVQPTRIRGEAGALAMEYVCKDPKLQVFLLRKEGKLVVKAGTMPEPPPQLVLIEEKTGKIHVGEFQKAAGAEFLFAEFSRLSDGRFLLLMEPIKEKK